MQQCLQWPGKDELKDVLKQTFDQNDVDLEDTIIVNQWFTRIGQNFWICSILYLSLLKPLVKILVC